MDIIEHFWHLHLLSWCIIINR